MKKTKKLPPLTLDPRLIKKDESLEDAIFRLQIEYLRQKIDPSVFRPGSKNK